MNLYDTSSSFSLQFHQLFVKPRLQSTLTSTEVNKQEDDYAEKESPPGQASGASMGDNRISCGVHLFDDPKSGAPYVVPLPDTGCDLHSCGKRKAETEKTKRRKGQ
eukprot:Skav226191  [mRNA]  locus=scaffold2212:127010:128229:+ [translate_table: standard]